MSLHQEGILHALPAHASYLSLALRPDADTAAITRVLRALQAMVDGKTCVLGIGASLATALGQVVPGLKEFHGIEGSRVRLPATPAALWCWLRAEDRGDLVHLSHRVLHLVSGVFDVAHETDAFVYAGGRDLSGYEDGTENPEGDAAESAALVSGHNGQQPGLDGSSYVAVQQWQHRFERLEAMSQADRDQMIGRRQSDNEELDDAPESAHVKRTAQENFTPEAFVLRRSMPWSGQGKAGLQFVAFGASLYAFEAQLRRMSGAEDGMTDALFRFTQPVTGAYFWCPPMHQGQLDLRILGLV